MSRSRALSVLVALVALALAVSLLRPEAASLPQVAGRPVRVAFLGDSLTAGYGLRPEQAFPALVAGHLRERGLAVEVFNHGVSGDTSADGLARVEEVLADRPDLVLVALGVNDGVQRRSLAATRANLTQITERLRAAGAGVALAGMELPPVLPLPYARSFRALYPELAEDLDAPLLPFLLGGVAWRAEWNQVDRVHPNAAGQAKVATHVAEFLEPMVRSMSSPEVP